jgi:D-aminoacyl-tRNA deacylase
MRAVVQRVSCAQVSVRQEITGQIGLGLVVLLGIGREDSDADVIYLAEKIAGMRVFEDGEGKMNLNVKDVSGSLLAVSQFTLYGDVRRGKRPSFDAAAPPDKARALYDFFVAQIRAAGLRCETGRFQETMKVELANEGPVTILLDSAKQF